MTTLALNQAIRGTPAFLQRLGQGFTAFFEGIGEARALANQYQTLARMTDLELAQRGLKRQEIPQAVFAAVSRR